MPHRNNPEDWENYKLYVIECLKQLSEITTRLDKEIADIRIEFVSNTYQLKDNVQKQLRDLADTVLKLQIRVGLICTGITIAITILANVIIKIITK